MKFTVEGTMDQGRETRKFAKEIDAPNERVARDAALKKLGGAHGLTRTKITITAVKQAKD